MGITNLRLSPLVEDETRRLTHIETWLLKAVRDDPTLLAAGAPDSPLVIGNIEIDCYVLEDETRVLSRGGFQSALGRWLGERRELVRLATLPPIG